MLGSARSYVFSSLETQWRKLESGEPLTEPRARERWLSRTNAFQTARRSVGLLYDTIGANAIYADRGPFDRHTCATSDRMPASSDRPRRGRRRASCCSAERRQRATALTGRSVSRRTRRRSSFKRRIRPSRARPARGGHAPPAAPGPRRGVDEMPMLTPVRRSRSSALGRGCGVAARDARGFP